VCEDRHRDPHRRTVREIDDELVTDRWCGRPPLLGDSELVCLAVAQALLQVHNEARWLRFVEQRLDALFPYRPKRPGYNKRLRAALPWSSD